MYIEETFRVTETQTDLVSLNLKGLLRLGYTTTVARVLGGEEVTPAPPIISSPLRGLENSNLKRGC